MRFYINYHPVPSGYADDDPLYRVEVWEAATGRVLWDCRCYKRDLSETRAEAAAFVENETDLRQAQYETERQ